MYLTFGITKTRSGCRRVPLLHLNCLTRQSYIPQNADSDASIEYSNECYCGNTINAGSVNQPSSDILTNGCSMLCGGNVSEYCGGPDRLDMYQLDGSLPVPTSTTSIPGTSPTPSPGAPSVVPSTNGFSYIGCYTDSTANRALTGLANPVAGGTLTVELCAAACAQFTYFGVEYSAVCVFGIMTSFEYRC